MTSSTTAPPRSSGSSAVPGKPGRGGAVQAAPMRLAAGRPKTPPAMLALCLLLMLGCGAGAGALLLASESTVTVVAAARALPAGTVIGAADLKTAELAGSGLAAIPEDRASTLLGTTLVGPVPAGTLLNAGMVSGTPVPASGRVAVGLALSSAQLPAQQLAPGRQVTIYRLPGSGDRAAPAGERTASAAVEGGASVLVPDAQVLSVTPATGGGFLVTVEVGAEQAGGVTAASSAGVAAVALLPLGTG